MSSPRILIAAAVALASTVTAPAFASDNEARSAAMAACKAAVAEQLSLNVTDVRLDRIKTGSRQIEMRLDARKDGRRVTFAECTYVRRSGEINVVVATPPADAPQAASN
ncbi:MAG: hypothetical protein JNM47_07000 [Hyphomonadaceae bacterium]|nr:hypothetical protein [Hyphomonadaceae bacterium]